VTTLNSIVEVVEEEQKKMERKRRMAFIVTIKRF
jgi:hypothetical protein